ncbi:CesT family type III secretion system chaperone [Undibacterium sp.]|uniref:CesT family type III secretion system chaperone n=1 Tax=Undibacterium sp. TaxID=1914977 RepID=UPI002C0CBD7A|nr:CesT family type III secretion system chaperone [Undibacterium sp.]HTD02793.1 CesT family type III secretion system chaperone [Undibacterium sp.]
MASENYRKLIDEVCAIAKIADPKLFYTTADLTVDGVNFTLIDGSTEQEEGLAMYCDFGALPAKNRADVLERLLEINLSMHGVNTPVFTINFETRHVLLARRIPIGQISALDLMNTLSEHAAHSKEWRKTYYLNEGRQSMLASGST